jgi:hypothetical protein
MDRIVILLKKFWVCKINNIYKDGNQAQDKTQESVLRAINSKFLLGVLNLKEMSS